MAKSKEYRGVTVMSGSELYALMEAGDAAKVEKAHAATEANAATLVGSKLNAFWRDYKKYYQFPAANERQHMAHVYDYVKMKLAEASA